jgi:hypothetical protein
MNFQPVVPIGGIAGWRFIERTAERQQAAFERSPMLQREIDGFREKIADIRTAEDLVADRQLLKVALGAFGLDEEIDKKAFLRKILEEGTESQDALAMRFVDTRYRELSAAFGFGDFGGPWTFLSGFADRIVQAYKTRQFEIAVGDSNNDMRLALTFRREIATIAEAETGSGTGWFRIMGNRPLREVIEKAYGLPSQFATLDIDRQREDLTERTSSLFGGRNPDVFRDPENVDAVINRFLARRQAESGPTGSTPGMAALSLLQSSGGLGPAAQINLLLSQA